MRRFALPVLLLTVLPVVAARVEQVPKPSGQDNWISDSASLLGTTDRDRINRTCNLLKSATGAELVLVTVGRCDGTASVKDFATELFNHWGIGQRGADNGVLILMSQGDRRVEVETGYGVEAALPDSKVGRILDTAVIPRFKEGNFAAGLVAAVDEIAAALRADTASGGAPPMPVTGSAAPPAPPGERRAVGGIWLAALGLGALAFGGIKLGQRAKVRKCPSGCGVMRFLSETEDDEYLNTMQVLEERLGGTDYRVWVCDVCHDVHLEQKKRFFSDVEDCPRCGNRTVKTRRWTVRQPSYVFEGMQEVERDCQAPECRFHDRDQRTIPRLQRTVTTSSSWGSGGGSSGGGGGGGGGGHSFGGGSSGGGGAGRSW